MKAKIQELKGQVEKAHIRNSFEALNGSLVQGNEEEEELLTALKKVRLPTVCHICQAVDTQARLSS